MGTGGMSAQMEPSASVHGEQARLLSICGTYSPGGFEPVGAAFRDGGGCWESRGEQAPRVGSHWGAWAIAVDVLCAADELSVVQLLRRVQLFATSWTAARPASLSFTIFQSLLKLMSMESVMPSKHLILCHPLLLLPSIFPSIRIFSSQLFTSGGQSIGVSASTSVLPINTQD